MCTVKVICVCQQTHVKAQIGEKKNWEKTQVERKKEEKTPAICAEIADERTEGAQKCYERKPEATHGPKVVQPATKKKAKVLNGVCNNCLYPNSP